MDQLDQAIYDTVHGYRDGRHIGAQGLAVKVGMRPGTLSNKANPDQGHELSLRESIPVQLMARDFRILYVYSTLLGHLPPVPFVDYSDTSNLDLINAVTRFYAEIGKSSQALNDAIEDGRITRDEFNRVRDFFMKSQQAGHELMCRLEALVDAD